MAMLVQLSEGQSNLLNTIARQNGFTGDFEVDISPGTVKGDNYLGVITKVTIKNNGHKLKLILKSASISEAFRKALPIRSIFHRELYIYGNIFEEFKKFQDEFNISNPFTGHAKLYGTSSEDGQECLVMENMLESGYKLWNRKVPMNAEHIEAVFVEYAKFHSISLAMAHKNPKVFKDLTRDIEETVFQEYFEDTKKVDVMLKAFIESVSKGLQDEPKMLEFLKKFAEVMPEYYLIELRNSKWDLVVNHGDSWCNNLMFQYEDTSTKLPKVCILDWQLSKMGSPAVDLTYFFLAHSPKEILYDYKNYLKLYHDTVCKSLREFLCDPEEVFPYSLLEQHWRKFVNFGLHMAMTIIRTMYYDTEEAPDLADLSESGVDLTNFFPSDLKKSDEYYQRVKDLLNFVIDTELICL